MAAEAAGGLGAASEAGDATEGAAAAAAAAPAAATTVEAFGGAPLPPIMIARKPRLKWESARVPNLSSPLRTPAEAGLPSAGAG